MSRCKLILLPPLLAWSCLVHAGASLNRTRHSPGGERHLGQGCTETQAILAAIGHDLFYPKSIVVEGAPARPEHIVDAASVKARTVPLTTDSPEWTGDWTGAAPPKDLVRAWLAAPPKSAAACMKVDPADGISVISEDAAAKLRHQAPGHMSETTLIRVGSPTFDAGRQHALLLYASEGLSIGGRVQFYYLTKKGARWTVAGQRILTVS